MRRHAAWAAAACCMLAGCAATTGTTPPGAGASAPACGAGERPAVSDSLYLGTDRPDGSGAVTPAQWQRFVDEQVVPRFPQGFTVLEARGHWRSTQTGQPVAEASRVLQLVHPGDAASDRAAREIAAAYAGTFGQEAVLRVRTAVCMAL